MNIYTIGFTKTSAENFFARLEQAGVRRLVDVRLRADSQLSGFAKKQDLQFFLKRMLDVDYVHQTLLAPSDELLNSYKKGEMKWSEYEDAYRSLISNRKVESLISPDSLDGACFLCSEALPHKCHRRIAAEYLSDCWGKPIFITHL